MDIYINIHKISLQIINVCSQITEDVDHQTDNTQLKVRWTGFNHADLPITYFVAFGSSPGKDDIVRWTKIVKGNEMLKTGLKLALFQVKFNICLLSVTRIYVVSLYIDA